MISANKKTKNLTGKTSPLLKSRTLLLITTYLLWVALFILQKPLFMLFNAGSSTTPIIGKEYFQVIAAGVSLDLSIAGFLTLFPGLILLFSTFFTKSLKKILGGYFILTSLLVSIIFIVDLVLYSYWGFRIDSTIFAYISSPAEVVGSVPFYVTFLMLLAIIFCTLLYFFIFKKVIIDRFPTNLSRYRIIDFFCTLLLIALMFIPMRGGLKASTINVGRVYFSDKIFLNHAAINPVFNLVSSMGVQQDFSSEYRYMSDEEASERFQNMISYDVNADIPELLNTKNPNIVLILLESFGSQVVEMNGGERGVAPYLNHLIGESLFFPNLYASSFRTDRALVAALAGYPAQPTMSILKYPNKVQALHSIPRTLIDNGYHASFLYGGDVNFARMKTLLVTQKVTDVTSDVDFPVTSRQSSWGVPDEITFEKLYEEIIRENSSPFLKMFLTLSSHEPFDVPTNKFAVPYFNSVAYTDSCLSIFIEKLKKTPSWDNLLIIIMPDHNSKYPESLYHSEAARYHSFMLWTGGAVKSPAIIDKVCSQIDLAPTLLRQLDMNGSAFPFGKDILNPTIQEFAFYAFPNGFGLITPSGRVVYDNTGEKVLIEEGISTDSLLWQGKAFLQQLYDDIEKK